MVEDRKICVAVADSNKLINIGLETVLAKVEDVDFVGQAETGESLLQLLKEKHVDVVLMDFTAQGYSLEFIPEIFKISPSTRVVAITPDQEGTTILNPLNAGVTSYVKKNLVIDAVSYTHTPHQTICMS